MPSPKSVVASYLKESIDTYVDRTRPVRDIKEADAFLEVPFVRQSTTYSCGSASFLAILGYYGHNIPEKDAMKILDTTLGGTSPEDFIKAAKKFNFSAQLKTNMTLGNVRKHIDGQTPVILDIQAWNDEKDNPDYSEEWKDGHYVVACGYDSEGLFFMDPSQIGYSYLKNKDLMNRWHDIGDDNKRYHHLGIIVSGKEPKFDLSKAKPIK